jgi:hypothetical protein
MAIPAVAGTGASQQSAATIADLDALLFGDQRVRTNIRLLERTLRKFW